LDVIICANFGVEKLRGLGNTKGQILEFPIEMAGHLYNRAGATAQHVIFEPTSRNGVKLRAPSKRLAMRRNRRGVWVPSYALLAPVAYLLA